MTGKFGAVRKFRDAALALLLIMNATGAFAQQFSGISVGDDLQTTRSLGFEPVEVNRNGPFVIARWRMPDTNDLSITATSEGTIVFMENDWNGNVSGRFTDFSGLVFGKTTLDEIRKMAGSNGFCYLMTGCVAPGNGTITNFNSYGFSRKKNLVVTFITVADGTSGNNGEATLRSIILAYEPYLKGIWGEKKISDPKYKPLALQ